MLIDIIVVVFGAIIGSFLNVCILRIPKHESLLFPRSRCPECRAPIAAYDNIPLISYLLLRRRCRTCRARISPRYFVVELLTAVLTLALSRRFGVGFTYFIGLIFVAALFVISFVDLNVRIVPNVISLPGILVGLISSCIAQFVIVEPLSFIPSPLSALVGALIGGGFLFLTAWTYERCTGIEGMGGGDIKLLAMIGAFLGWQSIPFTIFFASLSGSLVGLGFMLRQKVGRRFALPFAPFLCAGALIHLFFGKELLFFCLG